MAAHQKCGHGKSLDDHCGACEKIFAMDDRLRTHVISLQAINSDLLDALKALHAWQPKLTLMAAVARAAKGQEPTDSDTAEIRGWSTATVDAGLTIKAAEKQSVGEQS